MKIGQAGNNAFICNECGTGTGDHSWRAIEEVLADLGLRCQTSGAAEYWTTIVIGQDSTKVP